MGSELPRFYRWGSYSVLNSVLSTESILEISFQSTFSYFISWNNTIKSMILSPFCSWRNWDSGSERGRNWWSWLAFVMSVLCVMWLTMMLPATQSSRQSGDMCRESWALFVMERAERSSFWSVISSWWGFLLHMCSSAHFLLPDWHGLCVTSCNYVIIGLFIFFFYCLLQCSIL